MRLACVGEVIERMLHARIESGPHPPDSRPSSLTPMSVAPVLTTQVARSVWSGVLVGPEDSLDGVWRRLAATEPASRISPALVDGDSIAYLVIGRYDDDPIWELGAVHHGPAGAELANRLCEHVNAWRTGRDATRKSTR